MKLPYERMTEEQRIEYANEHKQYGKTHVMTYQNLRSGDKMWLESLQNIKELEQLIQLSKLANVSTVLEIGAGPCGTAIYFADKFGPDSKIVSVDLPVSIGGTPQAYEDMARAKAENWTLVRGPSEHQDTLERVKKALDGRAVGLLFIDGEHTRTAAMSDYEMYRPLLEKNGIIAFHDITLQELWPMWCELRGRRPPMLTFEFVEDRTSIGFGIGAMIGRDEGYERV